jgi:hypothetical protein
VAELLRLLISDRKHNATDIDSSVIVPRQLPNDCRGVVVVGNLFYLSRISLTHKSGSCDKHVAEKLLKGNITPCLFSQSKIDRINNITKCTYDSEICLNKTLVGGPTLMFGIDSL